LSIILLAKDIFEDHAQNQTMDSITQGFEYITSPTKLPVMAGRLIF